MPRFAGIPYQGLNRIIGTFRRIIYPPEKVMRHVIDSLAIVSDRFSEPLHTLETGTIRSYEENHRSTYIIAKTLKNRGDVISVDSAPESIRVCRDICKSFQNIRWIESNSITYLQSLDKPQFHFIFLDSANDPDIIYREFSEALRLIFDDGIIMLDDAGVLQNGSGIDTRTNARKGHRVWKALAGSGCEYEVLASTRNHGTQLRIDCRRRNREKILRHLAEPS